MHTFTVTLPFEDWLPKQRWYAGRNRVLASATPAAVTPLRDGLDLMLVDAVYTDGGPSERYQVVVAWDVDGLGDNSAAAIGTDQGRTGYDALHHPSSASYLMALIDSSDRRGDIAFEREPQVTLPLEAAPRVSSAEQSNTSVIFGKQAMFKAFRRVSPGINPDIEINRVLGRAGNANVATLLGSYETSWDGQPCPLGMLTDFAANSTEGWDMATASSQALYAGEPGGDLSAETHRLGAAVASVHQALAAELGSATSEFPVETALARLASAAAQVPELAEYVGAVEARFRALAGVPVTVQRMHGDLHLGQVLRTPETWLLIDFEGEPGAPLEERRRPDSPVRDVAGMLRSYEYAAYQPLISDGAEPDDSSSELAGRWIESNRTAFCDGYTAAGGHDPRQQVALLAAYELDKAVYEAAYEAKYRPAWLPIPLRSIARLVS